MSCDLVLVKFLKSFFCLDCHIFFLKILPLCLHDWGWVMAASFQDPLGCGVEISSTSFSAPPSVSESLSFYLNLLLFDFLRTGGQTCRGWHNVCWFWPPVLCGFAQLLQPDLNRKFFEVECRWHFFPLQKFTSSRLLSLSTIIIPTRIGTVPFPRLSNWVVFASENKWATQSYANKNLDGGVRTFPRPQWIGSASHWVSLQLIYSTPIVN